MAHKKMLAQSIADDIMAMITAKRFTEGDKLPNENAFARELNVSRNTLREAIRILNAYGFLEIQRGKGTFITAAASASGRYFETELDPLEYAKVSLKDLYELRLILEPEAAYLAALRGTDGDIRQIAKLGKRIEKQIRTHEDRTAEEHAFHAAIARATHNTCMTKLLPNLHEAILKGVLLSTVYDQVVKETLYDHYMITDFLEQRDAEGARDAMRIHIRHAIHSLHLK
ncbi:transcriptional regulator [Megasphaera cerevisiae DSM 20462]|uniref:Transcriptional regulator n=1 Tax=Megasphaera cerevisiae DSM 20462 TaxID=1122219 RepID=A0A0J6WVK0_9FIRM|nr:FadR/GntR family transcriptional regulator [Megasphaera cerevisiae]KMO86584.1 transcriptional regulator [Megasphaera cerevisiae DSM 20462]OKY53280.1 transcriptional regulator [Megasphaera cerevisiae]SJZ69358.1 transcriptional regulator, GntR family [Megasphaera cerevisiae DSM 20462]